MTRLQRCTPWFYLLLGLAQAVHSVEEILTGLWQNFPVVTGWLHARLAFVHVMNWTAQGFAAANVVIVAVLLAFSPFVFLHQPWTRHIVRIAAVIEILNGIGHNAAALVTGGYFSGSISAIFLFILGLLTLLSLEKSYGSQNL